jgi:hypothetical protein
MGHADDAAAISPFKSVADNIDLAVDGQLRTRADAADDLKEVARVRSSHFGHAANLLLSFNRLP